MRASIWNGNRYARHIINRKYGYARDIAKREKRFSKYRLNLAKTLRGERKR